MWKDNKNYQGHSSATFFAISQNLEVCAPHSNIYHLELNMSCNVKTKFVFLLNSVKVVMSAICFKVQIVNNWNMNATFLGFKWAYIKKFNPTTPDSFAAM